MVARTEAHRGGRRQGASRPRGQGVVEQLHGAILGDWLFARRSAPRQFRAHAVREARHLGLWPHDHDRAGEESRVYRVHHARPGENVRSLPRRPRQSGVPSSGHCRGRRGPRHHRPRSRQHALHPLRRERRLAGAAKEIHQAARGSPVHGEARDLAREIAGHRQEIWKFQVARLHDADPPCLRDSGGRRPPERREFLHHQGVFPVCRAPLAD
mmetsp:Transcript_53893/g.163724  ORF Transcript_53893/g.163724 Transcript_53893/m.163724 type:complete len:212 (+) Transcript_53893:929-1564(+)